MNKGFVLIFAIVSLFAPELAHTQDITSGVAFPQPAKINLGDGKSSVSVESCTDWLMKLPSLRANHEWAGLQTPPSLPVKDEFETTAAYEARLDAHRRLVEAVWVNLEIGTNGKALMYDADRQIMSVRNMTDTAGLERSFVNRGTYTGVTAFGVTAEVEKRGYLETKVQFVPADNVLPRNLSLPMEPQQAKALKERGIIHVLGKLKDVDGRAGFTKATLDSPTDFTYGSKTLKVEPICVAAMYDNRIVPQWTYAKPDSSQNPPTAPRMLPNALRKISENYPSEALRKEWEGDVGVRARVDATGLATTCQVTRSSYRTSLDEETCKLVLHYGRFTPATLYGEPVEGVFEDTMHWSLNREESRFPIDL